MRRSIAFAAAVVMVLALSACTNPYDPGQRAVGGGLLGAGTGAAIRQPRGWRTWRRSGSADRWRDWGGRRRGNHATATAARVLWAAASELLGVGDATGAQRTGAATAQRKPGGSAEAFSLQMPLLRMCGRGMGRALWQRQPIQVSSVEEPHERSEAFRLHRSGPSHLPSVREPQCCGCPTVARCDTPRTRRQSVTGRNIRAAI